jgi:hypothetical protein
MTEARLESRELPHIEMKWNGSPITHHAGTIAEIRKFIPSFDRQSFGLTQGTKRGTRINERLDTIVRLPLGKDRDCVPVGVVSKNYALVQQTLVLDVAAEAFEKAGIPARSLKADLRITEFGERMALSLCLPSEFNFEPQVGDMVAMRLECFNSADSSSRFRAEMGWLRLVCKNGLIVGVTDSDIRRRHVGDFRLEDVGAVLAAGIKQAEIEKANLQKWVSTPVCMEQIESWANTTVRSAWGFKSATRVYHIACSGSDVKIAGQYKGQSPTTIAVQELKPVPGSQKGCTNLFDVSQVLAWLAKERNDVQEQIEWREQIPELMLHLAHRVTA